MDGLSASDVRLVKRNQKYLRFVHSDARGPSFVQNGFSELRLLILGLDCTRTTTLFSTCTPTLLQVIGLSFIGVNSPANILNLINAIAVACPRLRHLALHHTANSSIGLEHIEPLFGCKQLIYLSLFMPVHIGDEDIKQIAISFPKLIRLCLARPLHHPAPFVTNLTLKALLSFATYCQSLIDLHICIDTITPPPDPYEHGYPPIRFRLLWKLNFAMSRISASNTFKVAMFLRDVIAEETVVVARGIKSLDFYCGTSHPLIDTVKLEWAPVSEMVTAFQARRRNIRKHEAGKASPTSGRGCQA